MTARTVFKEMLRTPGKTLLFLCLLALATALLVLGVNLYGSSEEARRQVSQNYRTVGTITQKPDSVRELEEGEAFYSDSQLDMYSVHIPEDAFDSLPTKRPVENRPAIITTGEIDSGMLQGEPKPFDFPARASVPAILTFTVDEEVDSTDETFLGLHSNFGMKFYVNASLLTLNGEETPGGSRAVQLYWPTGSEETHLYPGVEYIACGDKSYGDSPGYFVYPISQSTNVSKNWADIGQLPQTAYEYTPGFMETEEGQAFQYMLDVGKVIQEIAQHVCITVPTQSLALLDPFYRGDVSIKFGREITQEEFDTGAKVCMIPEEFRENDEHMNFVDIGDKIRLDFRGAAYNWAPGSLSSDPNFMNIPLAGTMLDAEGSEEYEVVGIYYTESTGMDYMTGLGGLNLGALEIIVPSKSYDFESITPVSGGRIDPACVSFELENGTTSDFLLAVEGLEYGSLLQVDINDQGYSAIAKGLDAVALLAWILLLAGGASTLCLLLFFVYLQIARRQREAAVQRSLGASRARCAATLLLGVLLVAVVGIMGGALLGHMVTDTISSQAYAQARESGYSREYSDQMEASADKEFDYDGSAAWPVTAGAGGATLAAALALSLGFTAYALRKEPLELLTRKE